MIIKDSGALGFPLRSEFEGSTSELRAKELYCFLVRELIFDDSLGMNLIAVMIMYVVLVKYLNSFDLIYTCESTLSIRLTPQNWFQTFKF